MISIIIPIIRPKGALRCVELIHKNSGIEPEDYEIVTAVDSDHIGCPRMVKQLVKESTGDMICFLGDDSLPKPGFLRWALKDMALLPDGWGLVGFNDLTGRTLPTHWLADQRVLDITGGEFFHTGYNHCFCDNELMARCEQVGRYIHSRSAIVLHDHPILKGKPVTGEYARVYSQINFSNDQRLFLRRRAANWQSL